MAAKRKRECSPDTLEKLIADGKIRTHPYTHYSCPTILTDLLAIKIQTILSDIYRCYDPLCNRYVGDVDQNIISDISTLTDFALCVLYNRLRAVVKSYCFSALARMKKNAPINNQMEFPSFLSSLLSSIGALRITDAGRDALVFYAPPPDTDNNYGRSQAHDLNYIHYNQLITTLTACGIGLSPIDFNNLEGAFWTTCSLNSNQPDIWDVVGTVNPSHYTNDDIVRLLAILDSDSSKNPFENP